MPNWCERIERQAAVHGAQTIPENMVPERVTGGGPAGFEPRRRHIIAQMLSRSGFYHDGYEFVTTDEMSTSGSGRALALFACFTASILACD